MRIPRWTVYPALGLIAVLAVTAVPHRGDQPQHSGAAKRARAAKIQRSSVRPQAIETDVETPAHESAVLEAEREQ